MSLLWACYMCPALYMTQCPHLACIICFCGRKKTHRPRQMQALFPYCLSDMAIALSQKGDAVPSPSATFSEDRELAETHLASFPARHCRLHSRTLQAQPANPQVRGAASQHCPAARHRSSQGEPRQPHKGLLQASALAHILHVGTAKKALLRLHGHRSSVSHHC